MTIPLGSAVEEAGSLLALLEDEQDELDVTLLAGWNYPPLALGSVRALYELAADICAAAGQYDAELVSRRAALSRRPR